MQKSAEGFKDVIVVMADTCLRGCENDIYHYLSLNKSSIPTGNFFQMQNRFMSASNVVLSIRHEAIHRISLYNLHIVVFSQYVHYNINTYSYSLVANTTVSI